MSRYKAFISYRHDAGRSFSENLEYALKMHGKPAWTPPFRVFRDEKYLVPGRPIGAQIRKAIAQSEYLVYLASPAAAASVWVEDELSQWLDDGPGPSRLILAVTAGEIAIDPDDRERLDLGRTNVLPPAVAERMARPGLFVDFRDIDPDRPVGLDNPSFKARVNAIVARLRDVAPAELMDRAIEEGRRQNRFRKRAFRGLGVVATGAMFAAVLAYLSAETARENQRTAEARRIATAAQQALQAEGNAPRAALLLDAALRWADAGSPPAPGLLEAAHRVLDGLAGDVALELDQPVSAAAFTPDGRLFQGTLRDGVGALQFGVAVYVPDPAGTYHKLCAADLKNDSVMEIVPVPDGHTAFVVDDAAIWLLALEEGDCRILGNWPNSEWRPDVAIAHPGADRLAYSDGAGLTIIDAGTGTVAERPDLLHGDMVSAAIAPGGNALFLGSSDDDSGLSEDELPAIARLSLGPDGRGEAAPLLDRTAAEEMGLLGVSALATFAAGGAEYLASGHGSGDVVVWRTDAPDTTPIRGWAPLSPDIALDGNQRDDVTAIAILPEREAFVTGHADGTLTVWSLDIAGATVEPRARFDLSDTRVQTLAVAARTGAILVAHRDVVTTGRVLHLCPPTATAASDCQRLIGHEYGPVALYDDTAQGRFLSVAGLGRAVRSWGQAPAQSPISRGSIAGPPGHRLVPLPGSGHLLALSADTPGVGTFFRSEGFRLLPADAEDPWGGLVPLAALPGGEHVLALIDGDRARAVLVGPGGQRTALAALPPGEVTAIDPTARYLAALSAERGVLSLYPTGADEAVASVRLPNGPDLIAFAWDGATVVAATLQGDVSLLREEASGWQVTELAKEAGDLRGLALSRDGTRLMAAGYEGRAWFWDLDAPGEPPLTRQLGYQVRQLAVSPDGRYIAGGTTSGSILLWDLEARGWLGDVLPGWLLRHLPRTGREPPDPIELAGHDGDVVDIAFSPDGRFLVSASFSWTSADNTLRLWPIATPGLARYGEVLVRHDDWFVDVAFGPDGDVVHAALDDGTILSVPLAPMTLAAIARRFAGRDLSVQERQAYFTPAERGHLDTLAAE